MVISLIAGGSQQQTGKDSRQAIAFASLFSQKEIEKNKN